MNKASILVSLLLVAGFGASIAISSHDPIDASMRTRAQHLFDYDRSVQKLPANKLYELSIALQFRNRKGAEALIAQLEGQLNSGRK